MKNNNKGFFLAEAIVMITLVTVVMAYVYPNVSNLYGNFKNRTKYWDQPEDIYALKNIKDKADGDCKNGIINADFHTNIVNSCNASSNFSHLYSTMYLDTPTYSTPGKMQKSFNEYLKKMKRTTNDTEAYRLIGVIGDGTKPYRYVSIKVDAEDLNQGE